MSNNWAKRQARDQQRAEAERQRKIKLGRGKIDKALDTAFTPEVFAEAKSNYVANFMPQMKKDFGDTRDQFLYKYARQGLSNSEAAARKFGELTKARSDEAAAIASRAGDHATQLRARVEDTRGELYDQLSLSADPVSAAKSAVSRSAILAAPPSYDPYQDAFGRFSGQLATAVAAEQRGFSGTGTGYFRPRGYGASGSRGSVGYVP